uniref:Uncharacterized protein n=1 Tax=Magallana gigas TaxID=29159 RepID=A0A8W8MCR8_MAGGI
MLQMLVAVSMNICKGIDGENCCNGYRWVQDKCIACEIGFYGKECNKRCLYPTFGKDCQSLCKCNVTNCDHVQGCEQSIGDYQIHSTLHWIYNTVTEERKGSSNVAEDSTTIASSPECDANKTFDKSVNYLVIDGKLACCTGYKLNPERNECILCDRGFRGKNCDTKCPYRTYGDSCQSLCNCNITYCDHVNGCTVSSEACEDGFFGNNCALKCPYPMFGKKCQSSCTCDIQNCDHANGCIPKSISNVTEADTTMNLTNLLRETKETKHEMINSIMFGMIGLAAVSFIIYMIYIYTIALEKDKVQNMGTLFITLLILLQLSVKVSMQICYGVDGTYCCHGYKWDHSHNMCIPCDKGFNGLNCDTMCQYPTYGQDCQSECKCDVTNCDFVNGCIKPTRRYMVQSTIHTNDKSVTTSSHRDVSNVTTDTSTNLTNPVYEKMETESKKINTLMFGIENSMMTKSGQPDLWGP